MEDSFKAILFGFLFVGLLGFLLLSVVTEVSNSYGKDTTGVLIENMSLEVFNESINNLNDQSENLKEKFFTGNIWDIAGVVATGFFESAKSMVNLLFTPVYLIIGIMVNVLKIPVVVSYFILGMINLAIAFGIWRLIKIGD